MPTIPDGRDFGPRLVSSSDRGVATPQRTDFVSGMGNAFAQDFQQRDRAEMQAQKEEQARTNRLQTAKAKSAWLRTKVKTENSFDRDEDYGTFEERWEQQIGEATPDILGLIDDPETRALFEQQVEMDTTLGRQVMRNKALARETDVEMAGLTNALTENKDAYMQSDPVTRMELVESSSAYIDAAEEKGYISALKAEQLRKATATDYVTSRLEGMEHREQLDFLRNGGAEADMIPVDVRQKIEKNAKAGLVLDDAFAHADKLFSEHGDDRASIMDGISKIKDGEVRKQARAQVNSRLQQESAAKAERGARIYESALSDVVNSGGDPMQVINNMRKSDPEAWMELGGTKQAALIKAATGTEVKVKTSRKAYAEFNNIARTGGQAAAREYLYKNSENFSLADFKKLDDRVNDEYKLKGHLSDTQRFKTFAENAGLGDDQSVLLSQKLDDMVLRFETQNEREPTLPEKEKMIDSLMIEHDYGWFDFDEPNDGFAFELPDDVRAAKLLERAFSDWEAQKGEPPTDQEKIRIHAAARKMGRI